jgi:hypothetical protein
MRERRPLETDEARRLAMKNRLQALILGGALLAGASVPAMARDNVSFSLSFGVPAYTYYAPPPPPVYYAPPAPVVYYRPAPAYYYGPPAVVVRSGHGWGHHRRHHHRHYR